MWAKLAPAALKWRGGRWRPEDAVLRRLRACEQARSFAAAVTASAKNQGGESGSKSRRHKWRRRFLAFTLPLPMGLWAVRTLAKQRCSAVLWGLTASLINWLKDVVG